jgi:hypothetical protein
MVATCTFEIWIALPIFTWFRDPGAEEISAVHIGKCAEYVS